MAITDAQIADLRDAFQRIEQHITELENRLIAVLDTLELGDDEPALALELGDDTVPF